MLGPYLGPWLLEYRAEIFIFILLDKFFKSILIDGNPNDMTSLWFSEHFLIKN